MNQACINKDKGNFSQAAPTSTTSTSKEETWFLHNNISKT